MTTNDFADSVIGATKVDIARMIEMKDYDTPKGLPPKEPKDSFGPVFKDAKYLWLPESVDFKVISSTTEHKYLDSLIG